jgi:hypothetical protein
MKRVMIGLAILLVLSTILAACSPPAEVTVPEGEVHYIVNPDYDARTMKLPEKYEKIWGSGDQYKTADYTGKTIHKVVAANIGRTPENWPQVGLYGDEVLPMGLYKLIPAEDVRVVRAAIVPDNYIGVYEESENTPVYQILKSGEQKVPEASVSIYPSTMQRYRTLSSAVLDRVRAENDAIKACESVVCETSITNVTLKGTDVLATIDADVNFSFCTDQKCAKRLKEMGTPEQAIQNWIATPLRSFTRGAGSNFSPTELANFETKQIFENQTLEELIRASAGEPIVIESVKFRSITFGSAEYQAQIEALAAELDAARQQNDKFNLERTQSVNSMEATSTAAAFENELTLDKAEAQAQAIAKLTKALADANIDMDWQTVYILLHADQENALDGLINQQATPVPAP